MNSVPEKSLTGGERGPKRVENAVKHYPIGDHFQLNHRNCERALLLPWTVKDHPKAGTLERVLSEYETTVAEFSKQHWS